MTRVVGSSSAALERAPRAPTNARNISATLSYDTELRWSASAPSTATAIAARSRYPIPATS